MDILIKAIAVLTSQEQKRGLWVMLMVATMAIVDTLGIASVMPFLAVLGDPSMIETSAPLSYLFSKANLLKVNTPYEFLVLLGVISFGLILLTALLRIATYYFLNRFIESCRHSISARLFESYLLQSYSFFLSRHTSDISKNILSEVDQFVSQVFRPIVQMVSYSFALVAIIVLLFVINPIISFLSLFVLGGLYLGIYILLHSRMVYIGQARSESNKSRYVFASEALGNIKNIKLLGIENYYMKQFNKPSRLFSSTQSSYQTINQIPQYLIEAIAFGGILMLSLFMLTSGESEGSNGLGDVLPLLGLYAFAAYRMQPSLRAIFQGLSSLKYGGAIIEQLFTDLKSTSLEAEAKLEQKGDISVKNNIAIENVSFRYPNASCNALKSINLNIKSGNSIGFIGTTGSGKTTLVDIILGLYHPTSGQLSVGGKAITEENIRSWQKNVAYVPQEVFLTDTSVAENIALGLKLEDINLERVIECAKMAQVHDFVMNEMSEGYDTVVGERGARLSGGQRQRIGIARALYRDADILVLDEATSALDTETEKSVMQAINSIGRLKTILIIAHRLSTLSECDYIVELKQGEIRSIKERTDS